MRVILLLAVVGLAAAGLYVLDDRYPWALEDPDTLMHATFLALLLGALLFGAGRPTGAGLRRGLAQIVVWFALIAAIAIGYENWDQVSKAALRTASDLAPGEPVDVSENETVLTRGGSGHFTANATINGERIRMLVDTGASDVAIPFDEARRLGIDVATLNFNKPVLTANGRALVAPVLLDEVAVGGVRLYNVDASVAEPGRLPSALLGMSFLGRLSEFSFRRDRLTLRR